MSFSTKHPATVAPGTPTVSMVGISDPPLTTTDVTASTFRGPAPNVSPKLYNFSLTVAPSHPAAPQAPPLRPPEHSLRLSYIPLQHRLQLWAKINYLPSKHSHALSPTSLLFPQQILLPWYRAPHLMLLSNPIVLHLLRGCPNFPQLHFLQG